MTWYAWIIALVSPVVKKVLLALGVGIVTYTGFDLMIGQIRDYINSQMSGLTTEVFQTISLMGVPESFGIILGAYASSAALMQAKRFALL